jgi:branched-chain amino acid aminotransferase
MPEACLDGVILDVRDARIPVTDEGLLRGDGVFEVIRIYDGRPFALDDHLARMEGSARNLRLPLDVEAVRADVDALLTAARPQDAKLRVVATRGGRRIVLLEPVPDLPPTTRLALVEYAPSRTLDGVKSLSYAANMLASRLARERGFDEALLSTPHGRLLEGPTQSFFCVLGGELCTPPLSDHILESITRRRVLALRDIRERPVARDDLGRVEEAFLASTTLEVLPVSAIEEHEYAAPGPVTREVMAAFRDRVEAELR